METGVSYISLSNHKCPNLRVLRQNNSMLHFSFLMTIRAILCPARYSTEYLLPPINTCGVYRVALSTKVQADGKKSPSVFFLPWDFNLKPHGFPPSSLTIKPHPSNPNSFFSFSGTKYRLKEVLMLCFEGKNRELRYYIFVLVCSELLYSFYLVDNSLPQKERINSVHF